MRRARGWQAVAGLVAIVVIAAIGLALILSSQSSGSQGARFNSPADRAADSFAPSTLPNGSLSPSATDPNGKLILPKSKPQVPAPSKPPSLSIPPPGKGSAPVTVPEGANCPVAYGNGAIEPFQGGPFSEAQGMINYINFLYAPAENVVTVYAGAGTNGQSSTQGIVWISTIPENQCDPDRNPNGTLVPLYDTSQQGPLKITAFRNNIVYVVGQNGFQGEINPLSQSWVGAD